MSVLPAQLSWPPADGSDISFSTYELHEQVDEPVIIAEHRGTLDLDRNHHKPLGAYEM